MKATLALEYIGEAQDARLALMAGVIDQVIPGMSGGLIGLSRPRKPWVAQILGKDPRYGLARRFLPANWQRQRANGNGSRGVELWFVLESGRLYEVNAPVSWRSTERYFCTVADTGKIIRQAHQDKKIKHD